MSRVLLISFIFLAMPGLATARAPRVSARAIKDLGPRPGHCGHAKVKATLREAPQRNIRGKKAATVEPGVMLKLLASKGDWLQVGRVKKGCFSGEVPAIGWLRRGQMTPIYLIASERRKSVPTVSRRKLYTFDRKQMVLEAFGRKSPTLDDEGGQGFKVWTTGDRRYPLIFHTEGWDMGPGSLTLFGPRRMLSLTSPGTRFTMKVVAGSFHLSTDHLCLQLGLRLDLKQLTRRRSWPRRFTVERVALRGDKKGRVRWLETRQKAAKPDLPVVAVKLVARDAKRPKQKVTLKRGDVFRPAALLLGKSEGEGEPSLEVELIPSKRRVLLDQQQVVKTTLFVHCAG